MAMETIHYLTDFLMFIKVPLQIMVIIYLLICSLRLMKTGKSSVMLAFFAFSLISLMLSDLFWIAYEFIRPNTRMPFAGNEIGEWAMFLLFGAVLDIAVGDYIMPTMKEMVLAALFVAANVVMWIGWSGEWFEDIMTGITFGYFLCVAVRSLKQTRALTDKEWRILGTGSLVLVILQTLTFLVPDPMKGPVDVCCYIWMILGLFLFTVRVVREAWAGNDPDKQLSLSFGGIGGSLVVMYMSEDPMYTISFLTFTGILCLIMLSMRRKVEGK